MRHRGRSSRGLREGTVTPGTVEETTAPAGLIDTPVLQHVFQHPPGRDRSAQPTEVDHVENRSIYNTQSTPPGGISPDRRVHTPRPPGPSVALVVKTGPEEETLRRS